MKRPYALIRSGGAELLLGPLDNHPAARNIGWERHYPLAWKTEAQEQMPPVEGGYYGEVFLLEMPA